jgi:hypothetical protein
MYNCPLSAAAVSETVEVSAQAAQLQIQAPIIMNGAMKARDVGQLSALTAGVANQNAASSNVLNLQRRVAGVLPVAIDVPHAGTSFSFVRPLVLDEETKVTFSYKTR